MGSGRNKELARQEALSRQQQQQALAEARKPTEAEMIQLQRSKDFLNWMRTPGRDIGSAPDIAPYLQIGRDAQERAQRQRMGGGGLNLADPASGGYAAKLREQLAAEQGQRFGAGLEQAIGARYAEATGNMLPMAQLGTQRNLGVLGSTQGTLQAYLGAPRETPFWQTAIMGGMGVAQGLATGGAFGAGGLFASDERLKDKIEDSPYGLDTVEKLTPKRYNIEGRKEIGFLAQDVEKIAPEVTAETKDGTKGVYYHNMVPILTSAIKELKQEVDTIKRPKRRKG